MKWHITGYDAERLLRQRHNIQVEMSDAANVVCICTAADSPERIGMLFTALERLRLDAVCGEAAEKSLKPGYPFTGFDDSAPGYLRNMYAGTGNDSLELKPSDILDAETDRIRLENAAGRISKGIIAPYPPGIPLVCPGETITRDTAFYLTGVKAAGGRVHGMNSDGTVTVIKKLPPARR
jgi:arginine decarboxylase